MARKAKPSSSSSSTSNGGPKKSQPDTSTSTHTSAQHGKKTGAPNTASTFYFSNATVEKACAKDKERIEKNCAADQKESTRRSTEKAKADDRHFHLGALSDKVRDGLLKIDEAGKKKSAYKPNDSNAWMDNFCHGQWFKPTTQLVKGDPNEGMAAFSKELEQIRGNLKEEAVQLAKKAGWKVVEKAEQAGTDFAKRTLEKEAAAAIALLIPGVGEAVEVGAQIVVAADGVITAAGTIWDTAKFAVTEGPKIVEGIKTLMGQADLISQWLKPEGLQDLWATQMAALAEANACLRARKCKLVPYKGVENTSKGTGCCPGQTGHHVLPDAMFHDSVTGESGRQTKGSVRKCWGNYKHGDAPTMCLEGTTNNAANGSHGLAHAATDKIVDKYRTEPDMPYTTARDKIADELAVPYGCSPACIKAQLDEYYKKAHTCGDLKGAKVTPHSGNAGGGPHIGGGAND